MKAPSVKTTLTEHKVPGAPFRAMFKNEYEQPSGSFKLRGIGHLIQRAIEEVEASPGQGNSHVEVFSSSGGNAGLAAAYASKFYNAKCTVVLPVISKQVVIDSLKSLGATVLVHGEHWGAADEYLRTVVMAAVPPEVRAVYCHPFDDPVIWDGHATLIDEVVSEMGPDAASIKAVVCSVGGGGLYNGVINGLARNGLQNVPVLAVETTQTPSFTAAVIADKVVTLTTIKTVATTLASPYVSQRSLDNYRAGATTVLAIDDLEAVEAVLAHYDATGVAVEPACGATLAFAYNQPQTLAKEFDLKPSDTVVFVVCGGSGVNAEVIAEYRKLVETEK